MGIDAIIKSSSRGVAPLPQPEEQDVNPFLDFAASPFRGVEGALQGIYDLADFATGDDLLPDYNRRFLGRSQTFAGSLGEGITQFLTGFIPVAGQLSKVGKLSRATKVGTRALNLKGYIAAGAVADFTVFQAQEERLSNLIESFPELENPVTEFFAADGDDGEIEGRLKNTLEGLAIGGVVDGLVGGLKALKRAGKGEDTTEVLKELEEDIFSAQRDLEFMESELNEEASAFYAAMNKKLGKNPPPDNAYDMLSIMSEGYEGEMRPLFDALLKNAEVTLKSTEFEFSPYVPEEGKPASYFPRAHKITFRTGGYRTFGHELLHATTFREIHLYTKGKTGGKVKRVTGETIGTLTDGADDSAVAGLYRTYDAVVKKLGKEVDVYDGKGTDIYGLSNIHEFVSEGFTNPEFRRVLSSIPGKSDPSRTMFDEFVDVIRNMLGLSKEHGTLLDDLIRDTDSIIRREEAQFNDYLREIESVRGVTPDNRGETFRVKGEYQGQPIENVPDGYLRKALSRDSVSDSIKVRIEAELNARRDGYRKAPEDDTLSPAAHKETQDEPEAAGDVTPKEAYARYLKTRPGAEDVLGQRNIGDLIGAGIDKLANDLETGGNRAILSAGKNIRTTTQALAVVQAIARNLEKAPKAEKLTAGELTAETGEVVDLLGGDKGKYAANIQKIQAQGLSLEQFRNTQTAIKTLIDVMSADTVDIARKAVDARVNPNLNKEALEVELLSTLDQLNEVQRLWSLMGREAGLTLVQRKFLTDPQGKYRVRENIGFNPKTAKPDDYAKYKDQNQTGTMNAEKAATVLAAAKNAKDADTRIRQATGLAREIKGSRLMDIIMEFWMNSLLSGPTTQAVNILGNSLTFTMRTMEQVTGSLLIGDTQLAKATLRYAFSMETIADSLKIAGKTLKNNDALLTQGSRVFDDRLAQSMAIGMDGSDAISGAVNLLGSAIRIPSRALLAGDEFFKQMNYRTYVKTNLAYEAMKKGSASGREVAHYVQKNMDNFITKGARAYNEANIHLDAVSAAKARGLVYGKEQQEFIANYIKENKFDETRGGLVDAALGFAKENTFTNDMANDGFISTLGNTMSHLKNKGGMWSTMNFVVPFLRTPTNIIKFSLDRTPFGLMTTLAVKSRRKEFIRQLTGDDPVVKAQAAGKLAMGAAMVAAGVYYVSANKEFITGGGPPDKDQLDNLRQSGWRPYSIKIGDTYYSYQRLDPLTTIIGLFADIVEGHHYHELEGLPIQDMAGLTMMSLANNVTNKSYLKGMDTLLDLVRDPVGNFAPFAGNIAGGFAPTFLSQIQNMADERELKETRAIFDYFLKKLPGNNLPARRNFMGEALVNQNSPYMTGIINPVYFNKESKDIVDKEMAALEYGLSRPTPKLFGALDMRESYNEEGRQAYDRMLELSSTTRIGGQTMRASLRKLIKDPLYRALPVESDREIGAVSPRVKAIKRLVRAYRRKARVEMLDEFPDLRQSITQLQLDRQQYRSIQ